MGLAPRLRMSAFTARMPSGTRQAAKTPAFRKTIFRASVRIVMSTLEIFLEIHARIEAGHLLTIPIEHQGLALRKFADASFAGLTPARVGYLRIDIGVEPIFMW